MQRVTLSTQLRRHAFPFLVILVVLVTVTARSLITANVTSTSEPIIAEIGVEHTLPLELSLEMSELYGVGILDLTQNSTEEVVFVSVPSDWERREVRNASLKEITSDSSSFGFTRWRFPPGASISFGVPAAPTMLLLHNPSSISLKVNTLRVDLETEQVERNVLLIKDSPIPLWE